MTKPIAKNKHLIFNIDNISLTLDIDIVFNIIYNLTSRTHKLTMLTKMFNPYASTPHQGKQWFNNSALNQITVNLSFYIIGL